jgi:hypothetical protein
MNNVCNFAEDINVFTVFILKLLLYNLSTKYSKFLYICSQQCILSIPHPIDCFPITIMCSTYNKAEVCCRYEGGSINKVTSPLIA